MFRKNKAGEADPAKLPMSELLKLIDENVGQLRDSDLSGVRYREIVREQHGATRNANIEAYGGVVPKYGFDQATQR